MPNWCNNVAYISNDDPAMLDKIKKGVAEGELMNTLFPRPKEEDDNWYMWNIENWGTKWDVGGLDCDVDEFEPSRLQLIFDSAWSPPIKFYEKLEEQGFTVEAYYWEPGIAYAGMYIEGNDNYYEYGDKNASEVGEYLPKELDEMFNISENIAEWEEMDR